MSASSELEKPLRGKVVHSDGAPVRGAKVRATAQCDGFGLVQDTTTADDGTFSFPLFHLTMTDSTESAAGCKQYQFRASKEEDYWIPSDDTVFSGVSPVIPTVDIPVVVPHKPVQIVLNVRGGKVNLRVWDIATNSFVHSLISIDHRPVDGKKFGSIEFETSGTASGDTELLPPGEYTVEILSYPCHGERYSTASEPINSFVVDAATHLDEKIMIDVRTIKPLPNYEGRRMHKRKNCNP